MKTSIRYEKETLNHEESHALVISFSILLILAITAISLSFWNATESSHDALAVNLAGRQRMLTQRIEKNLLKLKYAEQKHLDPSLILQDLLQTNLQFEQTLAILSKGKLTGKDGNTFTAASTQSDKATDLVKQANAIWKPMQAALIPIISNNAAPSKDTLEHALFIVMHDNQRLLILMDSLTGEIENAAHIKSEYLRITEAIAIALILVNFGFVLFYFRRQLTLLSESKSLSMRIMEKVGTSIIVINEKGDIELCNHAAERLFKYSTDKLTGENIRALLDEPYFMQIGKRTNGERFALDIDLNEIPASGHRRFVASLYDLTEQKRKEKNLIHLAYHDPLTALPNRLLFMDRLAQTIARAHRNREMVTILFIDLDLFKQVNDSLGHAIGDLLLQSVASRLKNCLREGDTLARLGGDEFTMIIDANDANNCEIVAQKFLSELSKEFHLNGHTIKISASIGASLYPNDSSDIHTLLHYADIAMYQAKAQGGNSCCKYPKIPAATNAIQD